MLNPFTNRKILRNGQPATAKIVEMPALDGGSGPSNIAMVLRLDPEGEPAYEVQDHWMVSGDESVSIGDELHVVIDGKNRHRVVIDWDKTREALKHRQALISRVMQPGVPVPVTRVRDAVEEVDPDHFTRRQPPPVHEPIAELVAVGAVSIAAEAGDATSPVRAEEGESLTSTLERLASLHAAGALTDGEFAAAKRHTLSDL